MPFLKSFKASLKEEEPSLYPALYACTRRTSALIPELVKAVFVSAMAKSMRPRMLLSVVAVVEQPEARPETAHSALDVHKTIISMIGVACNVLHIT